MIKSGSLGQDLCPPHLSICPYPAHYAIERTLEDGMVCTIRPILAEDEPLIYALFKSLSDETIIYRFGHTLVHIPHEKLGRYCQIDYDRELAFVGVTADKQKIIGDVRISKLPDLENAELSILISDEWQGKGIDRILMEYSIGIARGIGLKSLRSMPGIYAIPTLIFRTRSTPPSPFKKGSAACTQRLRVPRRECRACLPCLVLVTTICAALLCALSRQSYPAQGKGRNKKIYPNTARRKSQERPYINQPLQCTCSFQATVESSKQPPYQ